MTKDSIKEILLHHPEYDLTICKPNPVIAGWKISMQGKDIGDSLELLEMLAAYLIENNIPFKVATVHRYNLREVKREQSHKAMTIYCIKGVNFKKLCETVHFLTFKYKGWQDIKTPTSYEHYAGGLFIRNDRDPDGNYIYPNKEIKTV